MTAGASPSRSRLAIGLVALAGILLPFLISSRAMGESGWDPTFFVAFGEDAALIREYAEERLGEVSLREAQGHDGKFFFVQANDPWVIDPEDNAELLDRPLYRSQRMLYPVLAGGFGLLGPGAIVWAMLVVNLLAMAVGSWVVALIAVEMGGSPWWGLAFPLNIGILSELNIGGAGVVAGAAAFGAVLMFMRGRRVVGVGLLVAAVLAREAMLVVAAGIALWLWLRGRRTEGVLTALVPGLAVILWAGYLRLRIGDGAVDTEVQVIGWPFVGIVRAIAGWLEDPIDLMVGVAMIALLVLFTRRVLLGRHAVGWAFLGFVILGMVLTEAVWLSYFDITRALAPIITSFVLLVFLGSREAGLSFGDDEVVRTS